MANLSFLSGNIFSGMPLDRVDHLRGDKIWLKQQIADPRSRFIPVWNQESVVYLGTDSHAAIDGLSRLDKLIGVTSIEKLPLALLGVTNDVNKIAYFAIDLSNFPRASLVERYKGGNLMDLRDSVQVIPENEAAILSYARGLMYWHRYNRFCSVCGHRNNSGKAGHELICSNVECGAVHFPRTDSAVIVLVYDKDECLLCRQSHWPTGMHSVLAGFLEPGESLEESVAREIFEESGVHITDIKYHSSQPWPFPSSIMVGFMAQATSRELNIDKNELEYAHWYRREWLKNNEDSDDFRLPGAYSISRRLICDWIDGRFPI